MAENGEKQRKGLRLTVSTPTRTVLDTDADLVLLRAAEGEMGILRGHEPCAVRLDTGLLRAYVNKRPVEILAVIGGFAMVRDDCVTVLTDFAEPPDRVEQALADRERERAENKRREHQFDKEMQRVEMALRHTLVQRDISAYSIIKGNEEKTE